MTGAIPWFLDDISLEEANLQSLNIPDANLEYANTDPRTVYFLCGDLARRCRGIIETAPSSTTGAEPAAMPVPAVYSATRCQAQSVFVTVRSSGRYAVS